MLLIIKEGLIFIKTNKNMNCTKVKIEGMDQHEFYHLGQDKRSVKLRILDTWIFISIDGIVARRQMEGSVYETPNFQYILNVN